MGLHLTAATVAAFAALTGLMAAAGIAQTKATGAAEGKQKIANGFSEAGKGALTQVMEGAVARGDTPGVVALVVGRDGVVYEGAAGKMDVGHDKAMPVDAIFAIASMTKPVTSVAIMQLVEAGKIGLDDPVSKYLDGFEKLQVMTKLNADGTYETRPAKRAMTIRQLLTHTAGFAYGFSNATEQRLKDATGKNEWELPLLNDPGEKWNYSSSPLLLGRIVEKISGETLEAYLQKHILGPLGMVDTSFAVPLEKQARVVTKYTRTDGKLEEMKQGKIAATPAAPFRGDGGLYSTAQDYGKFMQMLLNGGRLGPARILSENSVRMMGENQIGSIFVELQDVSDLKYSKPFPLGAGHDKFGLGFQIASGDAEFARLRSAGSLSWAGIYNTEFWVDGKRGIGVVMLMQMLPFYDEGAIRTLREFEETVGRAGNREQGIGNRE